MKAVGMTGGPVPRAKPGDYERSLALLAGITAKDAKARLTELRDGAAAHDRAREDAEEAERKATARDTVARAAERKATLARQALVDESAEAQAAHAKRETAVAERERLVTEAEQSQGARDKELKGREEHLSKAGVRGF